MNKEAVIEKSESIIINKIRPAIKRVVENKCGMCSFGYGNENCDCCINHDVISTLQLCEAFIGSVSLDLKLNNLK